MVHQHLACSSPVRVYWETLCTYIDVRCRLCEGCMRMRQWAWTARAAHEQVFAKRTWFITLTYNPNCRRLIFADASRRKADIAPEARLISAAGCYVQRYIKTLRKRGFAFRYVCVPELHRNGFPHYHGLIHCQDGRLAWRDVAAPWVQNGFIVAKLVEDAKALRYVTKYLSKYRLGRVRSSLKYGDPKGRKDGSAVTRTKLNAIGSAPRSLHEVKEAG